jgi:hypothetical protein
MEMVWFWLRQANPTTRAVMEANPELAHALSDPETLRTAMQVCDLCVNTPWCAPTPWWEVGKPPPPPFSK